MCQNDGCVRPRSLDNQSLTPLVGPRLCEFCLGLGKRPVGQIELTALSTSCEALARSSHNCPDDCSFD